MSMVLRVAIVPILGVLACATGQRLSQGPQLEGARGDVERSVEGNVTHVVVHVHHLTRPSDVGPDATAFVVWARPADGGSPKNLGALRLDHEDGELETSTKLRSFELFITAEPSPTNHEPWGEKLMWTEIDGGN